MYHIDITAKAERDIDGHFEYIFQRNPQGTQSVYNAILDRIRKLRDFPHAVRQGEVPGTREAFSRYNYRIVFEITGLDIIILHVKHGSEL